MFNDQLFAEAYGAEMRNLVSMNEGDTAQSLLPCRSLCSRVVQDERAFACLLKRLDWYASAHIVVEAVTYLQECDDTASKLIAFVPSSAGIDPSSLLTHIVEGAKLWRITAHSFVRVGWATAEEVADRQAQRRTRQEWYDTLKRNIIARRQTHIAIAEWLLQHTSSSMAESMLREALLCLENTEAAVLAARPELAGMSTKQTGLYPYALLLLETAAQMLGVTPEEAALRLKARPNIPTPRS